jgi:murein DD-endopeptidase MepM/ murein hydrolase activator NlpD
MYIYYYNYMIMKIILNETQLNNIILKILKEDVNENGKSDEMSGFIKFLLSLDKKTGGLGQKIKNTISSIASPVGAAFMNPLGSIAWGISSRFGSRVSPTTGASKNHQGVDLPVKSGSPVYASANGVVIAAKDTTPNGCGGFVQIDHGKYISKYCHLSDFNIVKQGDQVKRGQIIGKTGGGINDPYRGTSTGSHLHYAIVDKTTGQSINPLSMQSNLG